MRAQVAGCVVFLAVAACSDPEGLTLEVVRDSANVTSVELFVGEHCPDCPDAMAPPALRARRTAIHLVNDPQVFEGEWDGDMALFRLTSDSAQDSYVPVVVAVGFDSNHQPIEVSTVGNIHVPVHSSVLWRTYLEPATPIIDPRPDDDGERIALWPASRNGPQCLMVEHGRSDSDTLVPSDDTDCDGVAATTECQPFVPNATNQTPTLGSASCITHAAASVENNGLAGTLCLIGGAPCTDGAPDGTGCTALDVDYCMPSELCNGCSSVTQPNWDACVTKMLPLIDANSLDNYTRINCSIPMSADGTECSSTTPGAMTSYDLDLGLFLGSSDTKCTSVRISDGSLPLAFDDHIELGGGTLKLANFQESCRITVDWTGPYDPQLGPRILLAELALDNHKHVVVVFGFYPKDCTRPLACNAMVAAADTVTRCTAPAPDVDTCGASQACPNGGVACGARCCGTGEQCINGACRCGDGARCADGFCGDGANSQSGACGTMCCNAQGCF